MEPADHVPSLSHLRDFTRARANGRATHVDSDRRQVEAPPNDRIFAFAYEKLLTAVIAFVDAGNIGGALDRAVFEASDRMKASYATTATGMAKVLRELMPVSARRRQRSVVVRDRDGYDLVSLRIHLILETDAGRIATHIYFIDRALSVLELAIMETAVAKAAEQIDPSLKPMIVLARPGEFISIDPASALAPTRIAFLRAESIAYRAAWEAAA